MITWSDDRRWPDAGKGEMEIDWPDAGIGAYVPAHLGHSAAFGVGGANVVVRDHPLTLRGAGIVGT
jgi:hypothetical protein